MDTVYPADHRFSQHWLDDKVVNGPGTADMKGGLCAILHALKAFEATENAPVSATTS